MALKALTPELRARFETLAASTNGILDRICVSEQALSIVAAIGRSRVPMAIPGLMAYTFAAPDPLRRAARGAINQLVSTMAVTDFPAFDQHMRASGNSYDQSWWEFKPRAVSRFAAGEHAVTMLGLFSSHSSGYVREEAVKQLAAVRDGREFGFLLVRLNDWIEAVRKIAAAAVAERVSQENTNSLIRFLPLILRMDTWGRGQHAPMVTAILRLLCSRECEPALRKGLGSSDPHLSRACIRVVAEMDKKAAEPLLQTALQSGDTWVRFRAAECSLQLVSDERLPGLCASLERDRATPVRRLALQTLVDRAPLPADQSLRNALLDRHAAIRELARFHLRGCPGFDARAYYLEKIAVGPVADRAIALRGLGETGQTGDVEAVWPFLRAPEAALRKSALLAAAHLAPDRVIPDLLSALEDVKPGISRIGSRALAPHVRLIPPNRLAPMLQPYRPRHVRKNALRLALHIGKWDKLGVALRSCTDADPKIASMARAAVQSWQSRYNRSAVSPSARQLDEISTTLAAAARHLGTSQCGNLRALIAEWRRR